IPQPHPARRLLVSAYKCYARLTPDPSFAVTCPSLRTNWTMPPHSSGNPAPLGGQTCDLQGVCRVSATDIGFDWPVRICRIAPTGCELISAHAHRLGAMLDVQIFSAGGIVFEKSGVVGINQARAEGGWLVRVTFVFPLGMEELELLG